MTTTRKNSGRTATFLGLGGLVAVLACIWLVGRNAAVESPPGHERTGTGESAGAAPDRTEILAATEQTANEPHQPTPRRSVDLQVPEAGSQDAAIAVVVRCADVHGPESVEVHVDRQRDGHRLATTSPKVAGGTASTTLTVPPDTWLWVRAMVDGAHGDSARVRLLPGEVHELDLHCGAHPTRLQVVGPSAELLPLLDVEVAETIDEQRERILHVALGSDGRATCLLDHAARASVRLFDHGTVPLLTADRPHFGAGSDVVLKPQVRLQGFVVRQRGRPFAARLQLDSRRSGDHPARAFVTTEAIADDTGTVRVTAGDPPVAAAAPTPLFHTASDVWPIDVERLEALGTIAVTFAPLDGDDRNAVFDLVAIRIDDQRRFRVRRSDGDRQDIVAPAGHYRLAWLGNDFATRPALDHVEVEPNATTEVTLAPRLMPRWTFRVQGTEELAAQIDGAVLEWPGKRRFGTLRSGLVHGYSEIAPRRSDQAVFRFQGQDQRFEGIFKTIDPVTRTAVLETELARSIPVRLRILALAGQHPPRVCVISTTNGRLLGGRPTTTISQVPADRLRVLADQPVRGFVTQLHGRGEQVIDWFEATAAQPGVEIQARGHWARVTCPRELSRADVEFESELGKAHARIFPKDGRASLHVPPRATAIHVIVHGARQTFPPQLAEIVVR